MLVILLFKFNMENPISTIYLHLYSIINDIIYMSLNNLQ